MASNAVRPIAAKDPGFDETAFLVGVENLYWQLTNAMNAQDLTPVHALLGPELLARRQAEIDEAKAKGAHEVQTDASVDRSFVDHSSSDASFDTIVVRIDATATFSGHGHGQRMEQTVRWTLQRPASAQTIAPSGGVACPSCGAPLPPDAKDTCPYCHVALGGARASWTLVRTEVDSPPHLPQAALAAQAAVKAKRASRRTVVLAVGIPVALLALFIGLAAAGVLKTTSSTDATASTSGSTGSTSGSSSGLTTNLALTGGVGLDASDLTDGEVIQTTTGSTCADKATNLKAFVIAVHFDSGATLMATVPVPAATPGPAEQAEPAAGVQFDFEGSTKANKDRQSWAAGPGSALGLTIDANDDGTLRWDSFAPKLTTSDNQDTLSGLLKFTCG